MQLSFRQVLALNVSPILVFTAMIVGTTVVVLELSANRVQALQTALASGALNEQALWAAGRDLRLLWLGSLLGFLMFTGLTLVGSAAVYAHVARRSAAIAAWLHRRASGDDLPPPAVVGVDALAALETAVLSVADRMADREQELAKESQRSQFDGKVQRALDLADTEDEVLELASVALGRVLDHQAFEVLLADSSDAHLRTCTGSEVRPGCTVGSPRQCAAIRRGQTLSFPSSTEIDACPKLRARSALCSAVCAPVTVMGRTIGVVHTVGATERVLDDEQVRQVELMAMHLGGRISALRTLASSEIAAQTDGMTGLPNRRTFESLANDRLRKHASAIDAVVMMDVDHFKRLNDTAGHDAGDRALRLVASVLRNALRATDLVARFGGEEFVLMLIDCDESASRKVLEGLRVKLADAVARYGGPRFTASYGVAASGDGAPLEELISRADAALYEAKRSGRDRVVVASSLGSTVLTPMPSPATAAKVMQTIVG